MGGISKLIPFEKLSQLSIDDAVDAIKGGYAATKDIFDFSLDTVSDNLKKVDPKTGETKIRLETKSNKFHSPDQVKQVIVPVIEKNKLRFRTKYKLINPNKVPTKDEYMKIGMGLAKTKEGQDIFTRYTTGQINKTEAAKEIQNIAPGTGYLTIKDKNVPLGYALTRTKQRMDPLMEGYISTLDESNIVKSFPPFLQEKTGQKVIPFDKVFQANNVLNRLNSEEFNNIKLPDGSLMKDQDIKYKLYNAFMEIDKVGGRDSYSNFIKKYINPMYEYKNPGKSVPKFEKPGVYGEVEGTPYIYDTRVQPIEKRVPVEFYQDYKRASNKIKAFVPDTEMHKRVDDSLRSHMSRMIGYAQRNNADPDEIRRVIENIQPAELADIFIRKKVLEDNVRKLKNEALSSSLKRTNPELYPELLRKNKGVPVALIELSHIDAVARNWKAALDINNLFLNFGTYNRQQEGFERTIASLLRELKETKSEKKINRIKTRLTKIEDDMVKKGLISKIDDTYFGADRNTDVEKNLLKDIQEAVDMSRYMADGGFASVEEVLEYDNGY